MKYFDEVDAWLTAVLLATDEDMDEGAWLARVKKQIKQKILESYRNGQKNSSSEKTLPEKGNATDSADRPRRSFFRRGR